jgi:hypothetical protein
LGNANYHDDGLEECGQCGDIFYRDMFIKRSWESEGRQYQLDWFQCRKCHQWERDIFRDIAGCNPDGTPIA